MPAVTIGDLTGNQGECQGAQECGDWSQKLVGWEGSYVEVRWDPRQLGKVLVHTEEGFLCEAFNLELASSHPSPEQLRQYKRLSQDPTFWLIGSEKIWERGAALTSRLQSFQTGLLTQEENLAGLAAINREWLAPPLRVGNWSLSSLQQ